MDKDGDRLAEGVLMSTSEGRSLRWQVLDRAIRPYAFAVALATAVIFWTVAANTGIGTLLDGWAGDVIGVFAAVSVTLLFYGFWARSEATMRWGLLLTTGVWAAVGTVLILDIGFFTPSALLAVCWMIGSIGAWMLEHQDKGR